MSNGLKIVQFLAENVKRLKLVEITPSGNVVQITGKNGSGKTSVLDSIWWALGGKDNIPRVPVHKGAEKGRVQLDLGEFTVERTFEADGESQLVVRAPSAVEGKKGPRYDSPQKMLDALVGSLSFDPLDFARAEPSKQFAILRSTVKVDFDFEAATKANAADFEARAKINKAAKEQLAIAASIAVRADLPEARLDESALTDELEKGYTVNSGRTIEAQNRQTRLDRIDNDRETVALQRKKIAELRKQADWLEAPANDRELELNGFAVAIAELPPIPEKVDVDDLRRKLDEAKGVNKQIDMRESKLKAQADAEVHEKEALRLTMAMKDRDQAKLDAVSKAQFPVPGIGFGDGFVTFNDLPFEQASDAERLRVSVAIAMATNPKLKIIRIRDGSLLDENGMKLLAEMAAAGDYQFWVEVVGDGANNPMAIVMEDGHVKVPSGRE